MANPNFLVSRTKIAVPGRRADLLSRPRLLRLLDDLLDYRLFMVTASAGYGKTSLLVDFAYQTEFPVCWYHLDPLDQDFQRFIAHFIAAIAERFPGFGANLGGLVQNAAQKDANLDHLVTALVNEAYERISEHFVLVLDDFHDVNDNERVRAFINRFVQSVDENCHTILASRKLIDLPDLVLMIGRSQVAGLDSKELAFRPDEIKLWIQGKYGQTISDALASELIRKTEGWITGLMLSADTIWKGMPDQTRVVRVSGVGLEEYLSQLLEGQPDFLRDFLLKTSLLEEFNAEMCQAVLGDPPEGHTWYGMIDILLQHNLFVLPVDDGGTWLRYHPLFRDYLTKRLGRERPEDRAHLMRKLADVYAMREVWDKAYHLYCDLGDEELIADLVESASVSMMEGGRISSLATWIDQLPAEVLESRPILISRRGALATDLGDNDKSLALLNRAEKILRAQGNLPYLARSLAWRATTRRVLGDYQTSIEDADQALSLTDGDPNLRSIRAEALKAKGLSLKHQGLGKEASANLKSALAIYHQLDDAENVAIVNMDLGLVYMETGRYRRAQKYYKLSLEHWRRTQNVTRLANLLNNMGVLHHLLGEYEMAGTRLDEALDCARLSGDQRIEAYSLISLGDLFTDLEAPKAALDAYLQARDVAQRLDNRYLLIYINLKEAALARLSGEYTRSRDLIDAGGDLIEKSGSKVESALWHLESGRLALDEGDPRGAVPLLETAFAEFKAGEKIAEAAQASLYLSYAYHRQEDAEGARASLSRAFDLASDLEGRFTLVVPGRAVVELLSQVGEGSDLAGRTGDLLDRIEGFERRIPALRRQLRRRVRTVTFAQPRWRINALGRMEVLHDGEPVTKRDWTQQRAVRELFFLILAHPQGLSKRAIGGHLWPASDFGEVNKQFRNAIYKLRRALGGRAILDRNGFFQFNRSLDYHYDVELLEEKLDLARGANELDQKLTAVHVALDLYRGQYLLEAEGTWVIEERERIWRNFSEVIQGVIQVCLEEKANRRALTLCERLLKEDPYLEAAYRLGMCAYAGLGDRPGIVRYFQRCKTNLKEGLGISPSPETVELYHRLIGD